MAWEQVFTFIGANIVMFLWMIRENNQDRREFNQLIRAIKDDVATFQTHLYLMEERDKNRNKKHD